MDRRVVERLSEVDTWTVVEFKDLKPGDIVRFTDLQYKTWLVESLPFISDKKTMERIRDYEPEYNENEVGSIFGSEIPRRTN